MLVQQQQEVDSRRDIEIITGEILFLKQNAGAAVMGIGQRLIEAKSQLSHGEWLPWLRDRVDFSERMAQNLMRVAREYENTNTVDAFGYSKALRLLALPEPEREKFVEEAHQINGQEKTVAQMSTRELEQAIRERDDARAAQKEAEHQRKEAERLQQDALCQRQAAEAAREQAEADRDQAEEARDVLSKQMQAANERIKELESRPVDVAVETVTVTDEAAVTSAGDVGSFKALFGQCQDTVNKISGIVLKLKNRGDPAAEKACAALIALADAIRKAVEA